MPLLSKPTDALKPFVQSAQKEFYEPDKWKLFFDL